MAAAGDSLYRVVTDAINDILEHGYDSRQRLDAWLERLDIAILRSLVPAEELDGSVRKTLRGVFDRAMRRLPRTHHGIAGFTIEQIAPKLHAELDRRVLAAVQLITLNREQARPQALRRFAGWATSVPAGGSDIGKRAAIRKSVRKGIAGLPYEERRCIIDQGAKLAASVNNIVAVDGGAIALIWHHVNEGPPAYDARPEHVARDGRIFVLRGNWAMERGLMRLAGRQYYDEVTAVGEEVFCRCWAEYLYTLRDLPVVMLTPKGRSELERVQALIGRALSTETAQFVNH